MDYPWKDVETGEVNINMNGRREQNMFQPHANHECRGHSSGWHGNLQVPNTKQMPFKAHSCPGFTRQTIYGINQMSGSAPISFSATHNDLSSGYSSPSSSFSDQNTEGISYVHNFAASPSFKNRQSVPEKEQERKAKHTEVEKKRRKQIDAYIKELLTLLPNSKDPSIKKSKGNILKWTVEYVKELKSDQDKIPGIETRISDLEIQNRLLLKIIGELEKTLREHGVIHEVDMKQLSSETSSSPTFQHLANNRIRPFERSVDVMETFSQSLGDDKRSFEKSNDMTSMQPVIHRFYQNMTSLPHDTQGPNHNLASSQPEIQGFFHNPTSLKYENQRSYENMISLEHDGKGSNLKLASLQPDIHGSNHSPMSLQTDIQEYFQNNVIGPQGSWQQSQNFVMPENDFTSQNHSTRDQNYSLYQKNLDANAQNTIMQNSETNSLNSMVSTEQYTSFQDLFHSAG